MNAETIRNCSGFTAKAAAAVLAFAMVATPGALAGKGSKNYASARSGIISHLEFAGGPAARMGLAKKDGKRLLYLELASTQAVRVVDVTMAEQPGALEPSGATPRVPRLAGAVLAANAPEILTLLNSTGTANSQQAHKFSKTARFLADARHSLIFVVDEDGLWIVKAKQSWGEYTAPDDNSDSSSLYGG